MNKERFQGNWEQLKGKIRQRWGKLTDDDVQRVRGNWEEMVGRMRERYGVEKDEAERQLREWEHEEEHAPSRTRR